MILVDTSGLLAALDRAHPLNERVISVVARARRPLVMSPFVLAEADYLIARDRGVAAELGLLDDVSAGASAFAHGSGRTPCPRWTSATFVPSAPPVEGGSRCCLRTRRPRDARGGRRRRLYTLGP